MKVKVAMYTMKVNTIKTGVSVAEIFSWEAYPGDFAFSYTPDTRNKKLKQTAYGKKGKRTIYLSSN